MLRFIVTACVLALGIPFVVRLMTDIGLFAHYIKHHPGKCRLLNDKQFSFEDFQVTSKGHAFITSGVRFEALGPAIKAFYDKHNINGKMFFFDFNKPNEGITELNLLASDTFDPGNFYPHGVSVLEDKVKGEHLLYVVNHPIREADKIEKFRYQPSSHGLLHLKTFKSDYFQVTNDVAAVKEDVFYVSNYLTNDSPLMAKLEFLFKFNTNDILLYNKSEAMTVVPNLHAPNGVLLSPDGKYLYVNHPHHQKMSVYSRDPTSHALTLVQDVPLHTSADNLHFSQSGDAVYVACHPIAHLFAKHMEDLESNLAPSQVLRLPLSQGLVVQEDITELFYDHGDLISASTTATVYNDLLLIGSVANNIVLCDTKDPLHHL